MKKQIIRLFNLLLLIYSCTALGQGIDFSKGTWKEIKEKARNENKLIFIDVYTSWCGPCKKLDKEIFPLEEVGTFYNQNFVSYKIDAEKGEGVNLAREYAVGVFPTMLFVSPNGTLEHRASGYIDGKEMVELAKVALNPDQRFGNVEEEFNKGNRNKEYVLDYFKKLNAARGKVDPKLGIYLSELPKKDLLTKENYELIMTYGNDVRGKVFDILLTNYDAFKSIGDEKEMINKIETRYMLTHSHHMGAGFAEKYVDTTVIPFLKKTNYKYKERLVELMEFSYLVNKQETTGMVQRANAFLLKYAKNNSDLIMVVMPKIMRYIKSKEEVEIMLPWSEKSLGVTDRESEAYYINSILKERINDYDGALQSAQKIIQLSDKTDEKMIYPYYRIAKIYASKKDTQNATKYANEALEMCVQFGGKEKNASTVTMIEALLSSLK